MINYLWGLVGKSGGNMFIGEYHYNIDDKGRLFIPSEMRKVLGEKVVINRGIEKCLFLYPEATWEQITNKLTSLSFTKRTNREFNRMFLSGAYLKEIDSNGRINISDLLLSYALLTKECVILGVGERIEIWDKGVWEEYYQKRLSLLDEISEEIDFDL